jgi:signal transduction histidine kinase
MRLNEKHMQRHNRRRWSIVRALVVLMLVTLAPFIVLEGYRGAQDVSQRRATVTERASTQAREKADSMDDFLRLTERFLATLASAPEVQRLDGEGAQVLFRAAQRQNPNFENIFLVTTSGEQRASTNPIVDDLDITERPYFKQALSTGRMAISRVLTWPGTGKSAVVLAYPVIDADNTRIGVLAVALDIARLSTVIGYVGLPPKSIVLLLQDDGAVIAASASPKTWVGQSLAGQKVFDRIRNQPGRTGTGMMPDGTSRVVAYEPLTRANWLMMAGIPESEVQAEVWTSFLRLGQQIALAVVATVILGFIVLRRVVVPIRILSENAQAFAAGFLNRRIPLQRNDELGDLADALNRMAASLERRLEEEAAHAQALRDLNQLQAEFVATASHELRTPVTAIRSYAEALMRPDIVDDATRRECLEGIDRSSERLARLVRTLLDVSRIDSGQVPVRLAPVDVAAVVHAAVDQTTQDAERVVVSIPAEAAAIADPDRLEDVLSNLIGNALKFSPPGAPVEITGARRDGQVVLAVRDHGNGIPEHELPRIFDRFYQVHRGTSRQVGGSGLGLYIARGYVRAMGGQLWAESAPGQGSTFNVALPAAEPSSAARWEEQDAGFANVARGG